MRSIESVRPAAVVDPRLAKAKKKAAVYAASYFVSCSMEMLAEAARLEQRGDLVGAMKQRFLAIRRAKASHRCFRIMADAWPFRPIPGSGFLGGI